MYKSTKQRIEEIKNLTKQYYEPGRHDRCKLWVWRHVIYPRYGISKRTFFAYLSTDEEAEDDDNQSQLTLFQE